MAFWNAPLDDPDHAGNAARAVQEMRRALVELNRQWEAEAAAAGKKFSPVKIGVGLNTGECVVGNFGSMQRFDYSLLGDPVNLAVIGTPEALRAAMAAAGWTEADPVTWRSSWRIVADSLLRRSYPAAPVSPLFVFGRKQTLAFEQEVAGSPAQRHHVRYWSCPPGWLLPGGFAVDLVGAATFDRRVGLSLFTFQVTHKIAENTDRERDLVVAALQASGAAVHTVRHFSTGYHARNGGGDAIETDGDLPIAALARRPAA
jgi:hypothetical protein